MRDKENLKYKNYSSSLESEDGGEGGDNTGVDKSGLGGTSGWN